MIFFPGQTQPRQAQLSWWDRAAEAKVGHYWIKTDLPADEANSLGRHLNIMYNEYSRRLASLPVRVEEKLNVMIFKDRQDYSLTLRARFGVNPTNTGGMFFANSAGVALAFWTGDLSRRRIEHVVQHEAFHQFAYSRFGDDLPIWVNEGLAEFFGEAIVVGDDVLIGQSTPRELNEIKNAIETNKFVPFEKMLSITPKQWGDALLNNTAALNYHQAWSMIQFLIYGEGGKYVGMFETYLKHLNNGLPSHEAFKRAFGDDVAGFEKSWKQYALSAKPSAFATALERLEFLAEGAQELARQRTIPESIDSLKDALRQIAFTQMIDTHGVETRLSAADDAMFQIPMDDLCREQPVFVVSKPKLPGMSRKDRELEDVAPTPSIIAAEHLKPLGMSIRWTRNKKNNSFTYDIIVR